MTMIRPTDLLLLAVVPATILFVGCEGDVDGEPDQ
jgi:hypothetical protein